MAQPGSIVTSCTTPPGRVRTAMARSNAESTPGGWSVSGAAGAVVSASGWDTGSAFLVDVYDEVEGGGPLGRRAVDRRRQLGGAGLGHAGDAGPDGVGVSDDRHVGRSRRPLAVEHRAVRRERAVDGEQL